MKKLLFVLTMLFCITSVAQQTLSVSLNGYNSNSLEVGNNFCDAGVSISYFAIPEGTQGKNTGIYCSASQFTQSTNFLIAGYFPQWENSDSKLSAGFSGGIEYIIPNQQESGPEWLKSSQNYDDTRYFSSIFLMSTYKPVNIILDVGGEVSLTNSLGWFVNLNIGYPLITWR